jgi:hypothetical protein
VFLSIPVHQFQHTKHKSIDKKKKKTWWQSSFFIASSFDPPFEGEYFFQDAKIIFHHLPLFPHQKKNKIKNRWSKATGSIGSSGRD